LKRRATPPMFTLTVTGVSGVVCAADAMLPMDDDCSEMNKNQPAGSASFASLLSMEEAGYLIEGGRRVMTTRGAETDAWHGRALVGVSEDSHKCCFASDTWLSLAALWLMRCWPPRVFAAAARKWCCWRWRSASCLEERGGKKLGWQVLK